MTTTTAKTVARMTQLQRDLGRAARLADRLDTEQRRLRAQMARTWGDDPLDLPAAMDADAQRLMVNIAAVLEDLSGITSQMQQRHDYLCGLTEFDPDPR